MVVAPITKMVVIMRQTRKGKYKINCNMVFVLAEGEAIFEGKCLKALIVGAGLVRSQETKFFISCCNNLQGMEVVR